jgi:hypothetical protein
MFFSAVSRFGSGSESILGALITVFPMQAVMYCSINNIITLPYFWSEKEHFYAVLRRLSSLNVELEQRSNAWMLYVKTNEGKTVYITINVSNLIQSC